MSRSARYRRVMEGLYIRDEGSKLVPMRFSESQEELWRHVAPNLDRPAKHRYIVLKSRQVYSSTFFEALSFVRTTEQAGTHTLVVAHDLDTSGALFEMAKRFHDHLPLPKLKPSKVKEIEFPFPGGTSRLRVLSAGTMGKGRGTTQTCAHFSEVAYWPHADVLAGMMQAIPALDDTFVVLESTANGMQGDGQLFYELWKAAVSGESEFVPIFIPWFWMKKYRRDVTIDMADLDEIETVLVEQHKLDGYQLAWRRAKINTEFRGDADLFAQEYPATPEEAFIATGKPAFNRLAVLKQRKNVCAPLARGTFIGTKWLDQPRGDVRIWQDPLPGHPYVIGADVATGTTGGDYSAAIVLNMRTLEQVASIHGLIPPHDFAVLLNTIGRHYNKAIVAIEVNHIGLAVQDPLIRTFYYPNLHPWKGKPDQIRRTPSRLYGWVTNVATRPLLLDAGRKVINKELICLHEEGLLQELIEFSLNDAGKYEARAGHDDRVIALLIALRSREENYFAPRVTKPNMSDLPLPNGVRVVEARETSLDAARRLSKLLRARAADAARNWMMY